MNNQQRLVVCSQVAMRVYATTCSSRLSSRLSSSSSSSLSSSSSSHSSVAQAGKKKNLTLGVTMMETHSTNTTELLQSLSKSNK
jgi:hypothetical protein